MRNAAVANTSTTEPASQSIAEGALAFPSGDAEEDQSRPTQVALGWVRLKESRSRETGRGQPWPEDCGLGLPCEAA